MPDSRHREIVVVGLGSFGAALARQLTEYGDRVLGVDTSEARVLDIADDIAQAVQADASDTKVIEELTVGEYDAVMISIGDDLEASTLATMNILDAGCKDIWVKATTPVQERILRRLGAHHVVRPEQHAAYLVAQRVHNPKVKSFLTLEGQFVVAQVVLSEKSEGTLVKELSLEVGEESLRCLGVWRDSQFVSEDIDDIRLQPRDHLLLYGQRNDVLAFCDAD